MRASSDVSSAPSFEDPAHNQPMCMYSLKRIFSSCSISNYLKNPKRWPGYASHGPGHVPALWDQRWRQLWRWIHPVLPRTSGLHEKAGWTKTRQLAWKKWSTLGLSFMPTFILVSMGRNLERCLLGGKSPSSLMPLDMCLNSKMKYSFEQFTLWSFWFVSTADANRSGTQSQEKKKEKCQAFLQ